MINVLKHVEQQIITNTTDFKNVTMLMEATTGLIILTLLRMDVTIYAESNEDSHVCLEMRFKETLVLKFVETELTSEEQDGRQLEDKHVTMAIIMEETDVVLDVLLKPTMMEEQNLDLFVLQETSWLLIIAMNGVGMDDDLMIQILSIHEETCFD